MISIIPALGAGSTVKSVVLETTGDTYVVTDNSNEQDPEGLRDRNFGSLEFSRAWYRWKVVEDEQLVSISLFQFDLTPIQDKDIVSAHLQLFALRANLDQPVRLVDTHLITAPWNELEMTYNTRPPWTRNPIASAAVYGAGAWYSWDVTGSILSETDEGTVSYALGLRALEEGKEEQVVFVTKEVDRNIPRLVVTFSEPTTPIAVWYVSPAVGVGAIIVFLGGMFIARRRPQPAGGPPSRRAESREDEDLEDEEDEEEEK